MKRLILILAFIASGFSLRAFPLIPVDSFGNVQFANLNFTNLNVTGSLKLNGTNVTIGGGSGGSATNAITRLVSTNATTPSVSPDSTTGFIPNNFDPLGAALAATNLYPWSPLYDPANAAKNATNVLSAAAVVGTMNNVTITGSLITSPTINGTAAMTGINLAGNLTQSAGTISATAYGGATNQFDLAGEGAHQAALQAVNTTNTVFAGALVGPKPIPANVLPANVVTNWVAPSGVDDTAAMQAAATSCGAAAFTYILLSPTNYYFSTNVSFTNNCIVDGQGATVNFLSSATNSMFDVGPFQRNVSFIRIHFNGGQASNYFSTAVATVPIPLNIPEEYDGPGLSVRGSGIQNRNGLRYNTAAGGVVRDCDFTGFCGCGIIAYSYNGTESYQYTNSVVTDCNAYNCFIGFENSGGQWDGIPAYGSQHAGTLFNASSFAWDSGEYTSLQNCRAKNCGIGIDWYAGNSPLKACEAENCYVGFGEQGGNNNPPHAKLLGCTANHNTFPFCIAGSSVLMSDFVCLANTSPGLVTGQTYAEFDNCFFGNNPGVVVTNAAFALTQAANVRFFGCLGFQVSPSATNMCNVVSSNCAAYGYANFDGNGRNDGSFAAGQWMMTNATATGLGTLTYLGINGANVSGTVANASAAVNATNLVRTTTNYLATAAVIDFSKEYQGYVTNASFTFGLPINVASTVINRTVCLVTNNGGGTLVITPANGWHVQGTANVTNVTVVSLLSWAGTYTNAVIFPLW